MIQTGRPPLKGAISAEIAAYEEKKREGEPQETKNKKFSPYWVVLIFIGSLAAALYFM